jgi:hypothetical protein
MFVDCIASCNNEAPRAEVFRTSTLQVMRSLDRQVDEMLDRRTAGPSGRQVTQPMGDKSFVMVNCLHVCRLHVKLQQ